MNQQQHDDIIGQIIALSRKQFKADQKQAHSGFECDFDAFIPVFFRHLEVDDAANAQIPDLLGAAFSLWRFAEKFDLSQHQLKIFTPKAQVHGWHSRHTILQLVTKDMPFLVDSICQALSAQDIAIHRLLHPVIKLQAPYEGSNLSVIYIEIDHISDQDQLAVLQGELDATLLDVQNGVNDWRQMLEKIKQVSVNIKTYRHSLSKQADQQELEELQESAAFIDWICDNHFTILGYRELIYNHQDKKSAWSLDKATGLGILRDDQRTIFEGARDQQGLTNSMRQQVAMPNQIRIAKANERAKVHRRTNFDVIFVKRYQQDSAKDSKPVLCGQSMIVGLFTSEVYRKQATSIPFVRKKIDEVFERLDFQPQGHGAKALAHVLETYPRDELFQIDTDQLVHNVKQIMHLAERPRPAIFMRVDSFKRHVSALCFLPKDRFSSTLRRRLADMIGNLIKGEVTTYNTQLSSDPLAQVLFIFKTNPDNLIEPDPDELQAALLDLCRDWADQLKEGLHDSFGEERGNQLWNIYGHAFPLSYQENTSIQVAIHDIEVIETLYARDDQDITVNLYQPVAFASNQLRLKLCRMGEIVVLSDIVPILENMGLRVIEEHPWRLEPKRDLKDDIHAESAHNKLYIHDFSLEIMGDYEIEIEQVRDIFHEALLKIWTGKADNDGFNRLILQAKLNWREIVLIRAYAKYLQQASIPFSQSYMQATLSKNPQVTRNLIDLFLLRFDPDLAATHDSKMQALNDNIGKLLDQVQSLDEDRILRRFLNLIHSTLRTNYFQTDAQHRPHNWLSFKFDSRSIIDLPEPAPMIEIFVFSTRFEAVHLRFGLVARGGLRWSDRLEDFRTEILGLVKAQQVKNAVIVPVGSKGGFVLKQAAGMNRAEFMAEGVACYKNFIQAMLDITDNLVAGVLTPPGSVVRHDGDDAYLVVAADKGTATFSDHANQVAIDHGFWLGDAFASGGSAGYDHKQMGITAKGAWVAVQRHFRELGHDTQSQDFTAIGVGDMAGDVFGNGMLLSKHIRLQAAFNHLHIFIDPAPDAASSYEERKRLFDAVQAWGEYDTQKLSAGGMIYSRKDKSLTLTSEIKAMLGLEQDQMSPNALIHALLQMKVDLLWFGGIGTYVKQSRESHADVGDRANDTIRVNANQLNCRVIGEGANLGMTQLARIEFAQASGAVNSDAIDNSAGVDCSDHEVNIKILLGQIVETGDLTEKQRNKLLVAMTDQVSSLVLRDNYQQTQSLSVCQSIAAQHLDRHHRLLKSLERTGDMNRSIEFLPDEEEFDARRQQKTGLMRPELAVLLAYAKNVTYQEILASDLPDDPMLKDDLALYFPVQLQGDYLDAIHSHKLKREIIATSITNSMINRSGLDFVNQARTDTGASADQIARAYLIVREVFELRSLWKEIEDGDGKIPAKIQYRMAYETRRTIERMTAWLIRYHPKLDDIGKLIAHYKPGVTSFKAHYRDILSDSAYQELESRRNNFKVENVSDQLAEEIGSLKLLSTAWDVVRLQSINPNWDIVPLGKCYSHIGMRFKFDHLRSTANHLQSAEGNWNRLALGAVIDDLWMLQFTLTRKIIADHPENQDNPTDLWLAKDTPALQRIDSLLHDLTHYPVLDLAMLSVAVRELRAYIGE
ncbi:MAG: NAD-glutamate dehydrogenase [Alphaproteobacteria bacterium]